MSDKYTLVHEGLSQWINSPNNSGECCQTWADTVDELNRLLAHIKRLEEALNLVRPHCDSVHHSKKHQHQYGEPCPVVVLIENAKEAKL